MSRAPLPTKPCARCGRTITWRKAWARDWDSVRWCSDSCRKHGLRQVDLDLQDSLEALLDARARDASVCPSEAARAVDLGYSEFALYNYGLVPRRNLAKTVEICRTVMPARTRDH